jgi:thiamine biosynthesis lipoprotein
LLLLAGLAVLAGASPAGGSRPTTGSLARPQQIHDRAWLLMGTSFEVTLFSADSLQATRALGAAHRAAARVDSLMSLYRPDSEIIRLNREAASRAVEISEELHRVLAVALDICSITSGAFDVTVKPAMDAWGFYRPAKQRPPEEALENIRCLMGCARISLDPTSRSVRFDRPGVEIDLGGIAKGFAVDEAARALRSEGIRSALINLGGNIVMLDPPPGDSGWAVGIRDPVTPDSLATILHLSNCAVASSGGYEKFVEIDGVRYGHIIDPRTAIPVPGSLGTSVVATTGMLADALSTALFVLGAPGLPVLERHPGVSGLLLIHSTPGPPGIVSIGSGHLDLGR